MNTIYIPKGRAKEYGNYALNIYEGCPHGCIYCFAPLCIHKDKNTFHNNYNPRPNITEETAKRLAKGDIKDKHIHLCFTCDPFPLGQDCSITEKIIKLIHDSGNYVQVLTKGYISRFDLFCEKDIIGITVSCSNELSRQIEPKAYPTGFRLAQLRLIKENIGCQTFVSCEPVFEPETIYQIIKNIDYIDEYKIGKLNYMAVDSPYYPNINWGEFGRECERLCKKHGRQYYIKESLRAEMVRG
jgi:DNA repair photolyase